MAGIIFYRKRKKVKEKERKPRFKLVAVSGVDLAFYSEHLRKKELEEIAASIGAELVLLKSEKAAEESAHDPGDEDVEIKDRED